jgi:hypothetical protein
MHQIRLLGCDPSQKLPLELRPLARRRKRCARSERYACLDVLLALLVERLVVSVAHGGVEVEEEVEPESNLVWGLGFRV